MSKNLRTVMLYLLLLAVVAWIIMTSFSSTGQKGPQNLSTSQFVAKVNAGQVSNMTYKSKDGTVEGRFYDSYASAAKDTPPPGKAGTKFKSVYTGEDSFNTLMQNAQKTYPQITYTVDPQSGIPWASILLQVIPIIAVLAIMLFFLNQMQGGNSKIMNFGKA